MSANAASGRTARDVEVDHPVTIADGVGLSFEVHLEPDRADYRTTDGVLVWMHDVKGKPAKKVFCDADGQQIGPVHPHMVGAITWAAYIGWRCPYSPDWWSDSVTAEVRANVRLREPKGGRRWWPTLEQLAELQGDDRFWLRPEGRAS